MNWRLEAELRATFTRRIQETGEARLSSHGSEDWFNKYQLCQLLTDGQPCVANLANEVVPAGNQAHNLIFAQTDFAEAVLNFGRGAQLFNANGDTRPDAA